MTEAQLQTLAAGIRAETNQACVDALAIRNDVAMTEWVNGSITSGQTVTVTSFTLTAANI